MKILDHCCSLLTNAEVRKILLEKNADQRESRTALPSEKKVYEYLTSQEGDSVKDTVLQSFKEKAISDFGLLEAEVLQLMNLRPDSELELPLIIEQCEDRLSEEQIEQLMTLMQQTLT